MSDPGSSVRSRLVGDRQLGFVVADHHTVERERPARSEVQVNLRVGLRCLTVVVGVLRLFHHPNHFVRPLGLSSDSGSSSSSSPSPSSSPPSSSSERPPISPRMKDSA